MHAWCAAVGVTIMGHIFSEHSLALRVERVNVSMQHLLLTIIASQAAESVRDHMSTINYRI